MIGKYKVTLMFGDGSSIVATIECDMKIAVLDMARGWLLNSKIGIWVTVEDQEGYPLITYFNN